MYDLERPRAAIWAAPLAWAYGLGVRARAHAYNAHWLPVHRAPIPVLSVGGIEAGGTGKTPVVAYLLGRLIAANRRPGLLTRGYGRQSRGLALRSVGCVPDPSQLGDEAAMLVAGGLDIPVAACAQRMLGAQALATMGCDCVVMDDGFSHRALHREVDIVVLRGEQDLSRAKLLPHGSLREPAQGLARASLLWWHHREGPSPATVPETVVATWRKAGFTGTWIRSEQAALTVTDEAGIKQPLVGAHIIAAAGIARPEEFHRQLVMAGANVVRFFPFGDHHLYTRADKAQFKAQLTAGDVQALVVTAKDRIKLAPDTGVPLWTAHAPLTVHDATDVLGQLLEKTGFLPVRAGG
jgi:tetraacyldisaccharide 4'-kinase